MRVAVISDIHANLPALDAAASGDRRRAAGRTLVPRRPSRLRPASERGGSNASRARADVVPRGQPRPRRPSAPLSLEDFAGDAGAAVRWTASSWPTTPVRSSRPSSLAGRERSSASTTAAPATRSGSTSSTAQRPPAALAHGARAARPRRAQPRRPARGGLRRRADRVRRPRPRGHRGRSLRRPRSAQSGLDRPAARRGSACCVPCDRHGVGTGNVPPSRSRSPTRRSRFVPPVPEELAARLEHGLSGAPAPKRGHAEHTHRADPQTEIPSRRTTPSPTNLEAKPGDVIGLAMAAQGATDRIATPASASSPPCSWRSSPPPHAGDGRQRQACLEGGRERHGLGRCPVGYGSAGPEAAAGSSCVSAPNVMPSRASASWTSSRAL